MTDDERGIVLIMTALTMTVVLIAASFAIDLGGRGQQKRQDHLLADLAALDAVRGDLTNTPASPASNDPVQLAKASVIRNGFNPTGSGNSVATLRGHLASGVFTPESTSGCPCDAVQVTVSSPYSDFFSLRSATLSATAVAHLPQGQAQFQVGSTLITAGTCPASPGPPPATVNGPCSLLNAALGNFGASTGLSLVGYNGLASGNVTLGALGTQLGFGALTPNALLTQQVSVANLVSASAALLTASGMNNAEVTALGNLLLSSSLATNTTVQLGSALGITQGNGVGLGTTVNLLNLITGGVELANKKAGLEVPLTTVNLGGLGSITIGLSAIVPPAQSILGPPGITATDTQVTLDLTVNLTLSLLLSVYTVHLPLQVTVGGATGTLQANGATPAIACASGSPTGINIHTTFNDLTIAVNGGTIALLGLQVGTVTGGVTEPSNSVDRVLAYNSNFTPGGGAVVTAPSNPGAPVSTINATVLGLNLGILNDLVSGPSSVLGSLLSNSTLDTILTQALGVHVGSADLLGLQAICAGGGPASLAQ